jgi:uncharacterized iron-regulated membrane protein
MNSTFWRKWHRWIGLPATLFLLFASVTGILVAWTEFFGADEALREATRKMVSPVTLKGPTEAWTARLSAAFAAAAAAAGDAPVDQVVVQFKGPRPTVAVFTGKPTGGEDRKFVVDATSGQLISTEAYADKPFIHRLHSGEAFGDGGLVVSMFWGLALALLSGSGFILYTTIWRPNRVGVRKWFW